MKNILYIVWRSTNETGVPILDEQHRGIVSAINSLYYFIQQGNDAVAFDSTLNLLNHYTRLHFMAEEALMKASGYPEIDAHTELHKKLMDQVHALAKGRADPDQVQALLVFLKGWWLDHINDEDREYVPIVKRHLGLG